MKFAQRIRELWDVNFLNFSWNIPGRIKLWMCKLVRWWYHTTPCVLNVTCFNFKFRFEKYEYMSLMSIWVNYNFASTPEFSEDFGVMNGQWVRVHTLTVKRKGKTWHSIIHFPYNPINFATFPFFTLPPIYSPWTRPSETILTNKASIERQINRLFKDI